MQLYTSEKIGCIFVEIQIDSIVRKESRNIKIFIRVSGDFAAGETLQTRFDSAT